MKQKIRSNLLAILDILLINISVFLAYFLRFDGVFSSIPRNFLANIVYLAVLSSIIKIICFAIFRLYSSLWKYAGIYELVSVVGAAFVSNSICLAYIYADKLITGTQPAPLSIFIITFLIDIFLVGGVRFSYRAFRRVVRGEAIRLGLQNRVLIIGGGDAGAIIINELRQNTSLKLHPVGIIDDDQTKHSKKINGVPIIGGRDMILPFVKKKGIDEIIIAMPSTTKKEINEVYAICSRTECKVKILPSVSQLIDQSVVMQRIRDVDIEDLLGRDAVKLNNPEIIRYIQNKTVLVTGGGGSIGSELCRQIASFGPSRLIILDNYENNLYDIQNDLKYKYPALDLVSIIANVRERIRIDSIMAQHKPHVVFHAAAHKHVPLMEDNPTEAIKNNIFGTMNVAECADKYNAEIFVLISTDKAVNPTNIMGATKRIAEMIIQALNSRSKTEFVAVRFGNVLGSNGSVIPLFKRQIEQGGPVTVTHPEVIRYFMTIPEAVQLVLQAGGMANGGEIFVLDMGEPVKIYDLAKNLIKLSGFEPEVDIKIEFTGLRPGEKLYEELLLNEEGLQATKNEKIHVLKPIFTDYDLLKKEIKYLNDIILTDPKEIKEYIKTLVPNYTTEVRHGEGSLVSR